MPANRARRRRLAAVAALAAAFAEGCRPTALRLQQKSLVEWPANRLCTLATVCRGHIAAGCFSGRLAASSSCRIAADAPGRQALLASLEERAGTGIVDDNVRELFADLEKELARVTAKENLGKLKFLVGLGGEAAQIDVQAKGSDCLGIYQDLLQWLRARSAPGSSAPRSFGPVGISVLRHSASGREVIVLGTPHMVAGVPAERNPVPKAVRKAVARFKPDIVAVELDRERGRREIDSLPSTLWGRAPMLFPEELPTSAPVAELTVDSPLLDRIRDQIGDELQQTEGFVDAMREVFAGSSDQSLAMNVLAINEMRFSDTGDWGLDIKAAVKAAAKAGKPVLMCDFPQEWTLSKVVPVYNRAWVEARQQRLEYLSDRPRALRAWKAEEEMFSERVLSGHGGDLPAVDYGLGLCRPAVGRVEAEARELWLRERDPAMARAVAGALEGRARGVSGELTSLESVQRALLVVGSNHVEGVADKLVQEHGFKVVPAPERGWATDKTASGVARMVRKPSGAGFGHGGGAGSARRSKMRRAR